MTDHEFTENLYFNYLNYKQKEFSQRKIKHQLVLELLNKIDTRIFHISSIGHSVENRELKLITFGKGRKKVLMWSQMHGDESTATMALFDFIKFLGAYDHFNDFRKKISEEITLYMLPMVNPDGAEMFERRNSHFIDLNRDVVNPQSPEARILKEFLINSKADFAFNLHDQDPIYSAGSCNKTAAISFLAPPYDNNRSINKTRKNAMKLISKLAFNINNFIPGHIGKYTDEFEPRAFGDFCQSLGTSTILIESGWWPNDPEKQFIRKINLILFASALKSIAENSYKKEKTDIYDALPFNMETLYDVVIRKIKISKNDIHSIVDLSLTRTENNNYIVEDIGDLSNCYGYNEFNSEEVKIDIPDKEIKPGITVMLSIYNKKGDRLLT